MSSLYIINNYKHSHSADYSNFTYKKSKVIQLKSCKKKYILLQDCIDYFWNFWKYSGFRNI